MINDDEDDDDDGDDDDDDDDDDDGDDDDDEDDDDDDDDDDADDDDDDDREDHDDHDDRDDHDDHSDDDDDDAGCDLQKCLYDSCARLTRTNLEMNRFFTTPASRPEFQHFCPQHPARRGASIRLEHPTSAHPA